MATCRIHEKHEYKLCSREAWEQDPEGLCILHSRRKDKDENGVFTNELNIKIENEDYDFNGVFFPNETNIFHSQFFSKKVDFSWSYFSADVDFSHANFSEGGYFSIATFKSIANFTDIVIPEDKTLFFRGNDFFGEVIFRAAKINGNLLFEDINYNLDYKLFGDWKGDFMRLHIGHGGFIRFRSLSLALAKFEGTNLRNIEFDNIDWNKYRGRKVIYEEVLLREKEGGRKHFGTVETLYRQLKLNYENQGDLKNSGDFHYGEMEMHRLASPWRRIFSWYSLYWALNGYGERPLRAFFVLMALILTIPAVIWSLGTESYLNTLLFIIEKAALQRPEWLQGITWVGKLWSTLGALLIPGQVALFLLALRNRLGRRR